MTREAIVTRALERAVTGHGAHASAAHVFAGVDWNTAGMLPRGARHSLYQLAAHMSFWQEWVLEWLEDKHPAPPAHAGGSWPSQAAPASEREWKRTLARDEKGMLELQRRSRRLDLFERRSNKSVFEMLQTIASHNSYHAGQAACLRQLLSKWPPPQGGLTW